MARDATIVVLLSSSHADREAARGVIDFAHEGAAVFPKRDGQGSGPGWLPATSPAWSILLETNLAEATGRGCRADGIIGSLCDPQFLAAARRGHTQAVGIEAAIGGNNTAALAVTAVVRCDTAAALRLAVAELVACGAITLVYVPTGPDDPLADSFKRHARAARRAGHVAAAAAAEIASRPIMAAAARTAAWCASLPGPVGIVAADRQAVELLQAARQQGIEVPGGMFMVGLGNDDLLCATAKPTLTSVDLGRRRLGVAAAAVLHAAITGGNRLPRRLDLPPVGLIRRQSTAGPVVLDDKVAEAVRRLRSNLANDLTPAALARAVGLSRAWLDERFRRAFGRTVHEEIVHAKLAELRRLLSDRSQPLADVAAACGLCSTQYMATFFKKHVGLTPGQFREQPVASFGPTLVGAACPAQFEQT